MQLILRQEPYALEASRSKWDASLRDPYCFENFTQTLTWVPGYVKCIQRCGINWLGIRFQFPILWFPDKKYKNRYMLTEKVERHCWEELISCNGYKDMENKPKSSFNITHLHRKIFDLDLDSD